MLAEDLLHQVVLSFAARLSALVDRGWLVYDWRCRRFASDRVFCGGARTAFGFTIRWCSDALGWPVSDPLHMGLRRGETGSDRELARGSPGLFVYRKIDIEVFFKNVLDAFQVCF